MRIAVKDSVFSSGLLIGINYIGSSCALNGCINDTENLHRFLISKNYFKENDLTFMNDTKAGKLNPTKANMLEQLKALVDFANTHKNDKVHLFFSYSGHGANVRDTSGDEADGKDEVLCPIDYATSGFIIDDYLRSNFIEKLGENVTIFIIIDACHSATMLDLKYCYNCETKNTTVIDTHSDTKCNVVMISGCMDSQTSADAFILDPQTKEKKYQGALTAAFLLNYDEKICLHELIVKIRTWLKENKYSQIPQLTSGKLINIEKPIEEFMKC